MFLRKLDYISPSVTFYYKGFSSHSSILSGIISVISFILITTITIYFSLDIIKHQNPTAFYFNRFKEEAGIFPLNASSFFHFISLNTEEGDGGFDFKSFRVIGLETYFQEYYENKNLSNYNHWLYGYCINETDTIGIEYLIKYDFFQKSACIRKYFSSSDQKYYDSGDPKFRWPVMAYGTYNPKNKFYTIILEKCEEETLHLINGEEKTKCKNTQEIKKSLGFNSVAYLFFIDHDIDVLNYENPISKYFYRIENALQQGNYPINHLNFFPSMIKTHNGLIFDNIIEKLSYFYERNDVFTYNDNTDIYTVYYLWLNNRIHCYERTYKRIQEIISNIGGIYQFITFVAIFLNSFYNKYIVLLDTENLLKTSIYSEKYNFHKNRKFPKNLDNLIKHRKSSGNIEIEKNNASFSDIKKRNKKIKNSNDKILAKSTDFCLKNPNENNIKSQKSLNEEKNKKEKKDGNNNNNYWKFILYKLSLDKNNNNFGIYQNFRMKIISEEHLIRNHLNIYNLLRVNERKIKSTKRYSYQLKDLIKLV